MTDLARAVEDYVSLRRKLGFKLERYPSLLGDFVAFADAAGAATVTVELAVSWATQPADRDPVWWSKRLGVVRGFALLARFRARNRGPAHASAATAVLSARALHLLAAGDHGIDGRR